MLFAEFINFSLLPSVNDVEFFEEEVPDGFFKALADLKSPDYIEDVNFINLQEMHSHIIEIAKAGPPIPSLNYDDTESILKSLHQSVTDFYSLYRNIF